MYNIPAEPAIFDAISFMCKLNFILESMVTPRNLTVGVMAMGLLFMYICGGSYVRFVRINVCVFCVLMERRFALVHSLNLFRSSLQFCAMDCIFVPWHVSVVSSAYRMGDICLSVCGISFMYNRNNVQLRTDPVGSPVGIIL